MTTHSQILLSNTKLTLEEVLKPREAIVKTFPTDLVNILAIFFYQIKLEKQSKSILTILLININLKHKNKTNINLEIESKLARTKDSVTTKKNKLK